MRVEAPVGTVALFFTDIEGSTGLARVLGDAWPEVVDRHHELLQDVIVAHDGFIEGQRGDGFFATFASASAAVDAAAAAQRAMHGQPWPREVRVRIGVHVGHVDRTAGGYAGLEIHRAARISAAAHGGQVLLSGAAVAAAGGPDPRFEDLGLHRMKDFPVPERLFGLRPADGTTFPPPMSLDVRPTNLPAAGEPPVGRRDVLKLVAERLAHARLVTLTGRGGTGKTTVALAASNEALERFPGGVWWVSLAATSADGVWPAVAAAVHAEAGRAEPLEALERRFDGRGDALLVLDNLEHVLAVGPELATLLQRTPDLRVLATSQAPLRLRDEMVLELEPLAPQSALALFDRVAARARDTIGLRETEIADAAEICRQLDGLPLAIELAAGRLSLLSTSQLRARIDASLSVVRQTGAHDDRQRSLEATLDWTLGLLDAPARALFVRLGLFAGPVELEEIEHVAGDDGLDVLEALAMLREVSLVSPVETGDGRMRFGLAETLRRMAADRLATGPDPERWHRRHAARQLERSWGGRLMHAETIAEAREAAEAEPEALLAVERMDQVAPDLATALRAVVATRLVKVGRLAQARSLLDATQTRPDDPVIRATQLLAHAVLTLERGERSDALALFDEALAAAGDRDRLLASSVLIMRAYCQTVTGAPAGGIADSRAAIAVAPPGSAAQAGALLMEAQAHLVAGDLDRAAQRLDASIRMAAPTDAAVAWAHDSVAGDIAFERGQFAAAAARFAQSLQDAEQRQDGQQSAFDLIALAGTLASLGDDHAATHLLGMLDAHCAMVGADIDALLPVSTGRDAAEAAEARLGPAAAGARRAGAEVPPGLRITRACELTAQCLASQVPHARATPGRQQAVAARIIARSSASTLVAGDEPSSNAPA